MPGQMLIGAGAGYSGDRVDAPIAVVRDLRASGERAAIIFETLGERTLALAQLRRRENPGAGYEPKLKELLAPVLKDCVDSNIAIIGNFGAGNPPAAADVIAKLATDIGAAARIGVVTGDDMLGPEGLEILRASANDLPDAESIVSANVYLGAAPIVEALAQGAQIVVTGRVADPSLTLAPLIHAFGWGYDDWMKLGCGTMAGHLLECGAQVTGGYFADPGYKDVLSPENIGFPIATIDSDGRFTIGKAAGGGLVDRRTVTEQLLYEVHDPAAYLTPDVTADISNATLIELGGDRVRVDGVTGHKRPDRLKVTVCYDGGWLGEGEISYYGPNAAARARLAAEIVRRRSPPDIRMRCDLIGVLSVMADDSGHAWDSFDFNRDAMTEDVRLRVAFSAPDKATVERGLAEVKRSIAPDPQAAAAFDWRFGRALQQRPASCRATPFDLESKSGRCDMDSLRLHALAHGRTGDKGNRLNISLIAYTPELYPLLTTAVTEDVVAKRFAARKPSSVKRYLLPNLLAMNFVLDDVLDGGVTQALNLDSHGKTLSFHLLGLSINVPDDLVKFARINKQQRS